MIKLTKLTEPKVLTDNGAEWTKIHLANISNNIESTTYLKSRYNHKEIKEQIVKETYGKCAYCESKLRHIHHGDIEHIYPKSLDESKRFEWVNLTLACEVCNQNKSNLDPLMLDIQDPYVGHPENILMFAGPLVFGLDSKGLSTEKILKLNRTELIEQRKERIEKILLIIQNILDSTIPLATRRIIYDDLITNEASQSAEYSAMVKCTINQMESRIIAILK
ncbi:HNH endonuclease [Rahnella sikkimica]|uniref:HNH domain-containing protein n=1 Tax=Rahnella sikkimica TaxID=1805933 RepID=A0A2L1UQ79_9GAMM|nr:HNH endonuclease [Rahnella sikkimica]AVF35082.1 hypothetical protein BV494_09110 [Rahnella sikkimica]